MDIINIIHVFFSFISLKAHFRKILNVNNTSGSIIIIVIKILIHRIWISNENDLFYFYCLKHKITVVMFLVTIVHDKISHSVHSIIHENDQFYVYCTYIMLFINWQNKLEGNINLSKKLYLVLKECRQIDIFKSNDQYDLCTKYVCLHLQNHLIPNFVHTKKS